VPNLLLTTRCVRACPYCFAKDNQNESKDDFLKLEDLIFVTDFLKVSRIDHLGILGGEPGIHPQFTTFIKYLITRGIYCNIFTSGILSTKTKENLLKLIEQFHPQRNLNSNDRPVLGFTVNINSESDSAPSEIKAQEDFLNYFGALCTPGINIFRPDQDFSYIIDYIYKFKTKKQIRMSLAHPIYQESNIYLHPDQFSPIQEKLSQFIQKTFDYDIRISFDCGFPLCFFDDKTLATIFRAKLKYSPVCSPIVDFGPDLQVWACFPLKKFEQKSLYDFNHFNDIIQYFAQKVSESIKQSTNLGVFDQCKICTYYKRNLCSGGCIAWSVS